MVEALVLYATSTSDQKITLPNADAMDMSKSFFEKHAQDRSCTKGRQYITAQGVS